jgi:hypothetical protein
VRRDAYHSVILFTEAATNVLNNDLTSCANQLLVTAPRHQASHGGGRNFEAALLTGQNVMEQNRSAERLVTFKFYLAIVQLIYFDTSVTQRPSQSTSHGLPV